MNCREGDRVVHKGSLNLGKIGAVLRPSQPGDIGHGWIVSNGLGAGWFCECLVNSGWAGTLGSSHMFAAIADKFLRPIRDPGDDAQDESLSWKKVPSTDKREELA